MDEPINDAIATQDQASSSSELPKPPPTPGHFPPYDEHKPWNPGLLLRFLQSPFQYSRENLANVSPDVVTGLAFVCGAGASASSQAIQIVAAALKGSSLSQMDKMASVASPSWGTYWGKVWILGAIIGIFRWFVSGWWYAFRINLCGDKKANHEYARVVFVHVDAMWAIAVLSVSIFDTFVYPNPGATWAASHHNLITLVLAVSYWYSYQAVRGSFDVSRRKALFWFFIAPLGFMMSTQLIGFISGFLVGAAAHH